MGEKSRLNQFPVILRVSSSRLFPAIGTPKPWKSWMTTTVGECDSCGWWSHPSKSFTPMPVERSARFPPWKSPNTMSDLSPSISSDDPVRIPITDTFDLHTIAPRDVKPPVEAYLKQPHPPRPPPLRIIHARVTALHPSIVRT